MSLTTFIYLKTSPISMIPMSLSTLIFLITVSQTTLISQITMSLTTLTYLMTMSLTILKPFLKDMSVVSVIGSIPNGFGTVVFGLKHSLMEALIYGVPCQLGWAMSYDDGQDMTIDTRIIVGGGIHFKK